MTITVRTTYTVNGGDEQSSNIQIPIPEGKDPKAMSDVELMTLAANTLVASGQIMVSNATIALDAPAEPS